MRRADPILVCLYLALAMLPVIGMLGAFRDQQIAGVFDSPPAPELTVDTFKSEAFQHTATAWFERRIGTRNYAIRFDNSLLYHVFGESKFLANVKVGRRGVLFERDDINFLNTPAKMFPKQQAIDDLADQLARMQQRLASRGIALVPVIVPGKPALWRDAVPDRMIRQLDEPRPAGPLGYERIEQALAGRGVVYLDVQKMFTTSTIPRELLWGADARHWSSYGACLVVGQIMERYHHLTETPAISYDCTYKLARPRRHDDDIDLWRLLNAWYVRRTAKEVPIAVHSPPDPAAAKPRIMITSSSFGWQLMRDAEQSQRFRAVHLNYYDSEIFTSDVKASVKVAGRSQAWREVMLGNDIYVVELFLPYLSSSPEHFVTRALTALEQELPAP